MVGKSNAKGAGVAPIATWLYGYDLTVATSSPTARVTYPAEVYNYLFTPALMTHGVKFDYGSWGSGCWGSMAGIGFMPRPCMLLYDGTVDYYLDPNNYARKADGTASDIADTAYGGNAMMEWGKLYTKRSFSAGVYSFRVSNAKIDETYDCWCNYDINNNEIPHFYTPIYFGSSVGGKLRSISGQTNSVSTTRAQEITLATANGAGWYTEVIADRFLIQDLLVMMARSTDTQVAYGYGRVASGNTSAIGQGTMNANGLFWSGSDGTGGVKVFGMENWWGNLWRATAGYLNVNGTQKVKITRGTHDGSVATDYSLDGTDYISLTGSTPTGTSDGYINSMLNDLTYGRFPITASGATTTYECDGMTFNNAISGYAICGGSWITTTKAGAFYTGLASDNTFTSVTTGAALSCKPLVA